MTAVAVVGHPFSSIGMGEQVRSGYAALRAVGVDAKLYDIYRHEERTDVDLRTLVLPNECVDLNDHPVRVFHINGDEVDDALAALAERGVDFSCGYNIIVPAWELPTYPTVWKSKLANFNEVWAISKFVNSSFEKGGIQSRHIGQSVEKRYGTLLGRKYFGIRESSFVILNFFDTKSFPTRKNPDAVLELYKRIRKARPYEDIQLVLKMRSGEMAVTNTLDILTAEIPREVRLIPANLSTHEAYSLISACDCFASLHRSEGFGRGLAEAMWLGRLALGTGWSGNCDFMDRHNSLMVNYSLVDVKDGEYPHSEGQHWAEPELDHAEFLLKQMIDDWSTAKTMRKLARLTALSQCSNRAVGLRYIQHLRAATLKQSAFVDNSGLGR